MFYLSSYLFLQTTRNPIARFQVKTNLNARFDWQTKKNTNRKRIITRV